MQRSIATTLAIYLAATVCPFFANAEEMRSPGQLVSAAVGVDRSPTGLRAQNTTIDWQLHRHGSLTGQVVDRFGKPISNANVLLANPKGKVAEAQTDDQGLFQFNQSSTGAMALIVGKHVQTVRIWGAGTAPPIAKHKVMFVVGDVVRSQSCESGPNCSGCDACGENGGFQGHFGGIFQRMLQNPWLVGAGTAAAIAIPLATADDDERPGDDAPPAS